MLRPSLFACRVHQHLVRSRQNVALMFVERNTARIGSTFRHESLTAR
jgi:hypothetical protein